MLFSFFLFSSRAKAPRARLLWAPSRSSASLRGSASAAMGRDTVRTASSPQRTARAQRRKRREEEKTRREEKFPLPAQLQMASACRKSGATTFQATHTGRFSALPLTGFVGMRIQRACYISTVPEALWATLENWLVCATCGTRRRASIFEIFRFSSFAARSASFASELRTSKAPASLRHAETQHRSNTSMICHPAFCHGTTSSMIESSKHRCEWCQLRWSLQTFYTRSQPAV